MHRVNPITRGIWLSLLLSGPLGGLAHAEDVATPSEEGASKSTALKTVTVTAQRREETEQEIPTAISVVKGENLTAEGARYIGDVTTFTPNASAKNPDGNARPRWIIRGLGAGDTGAATVYPVGIYADDVYLNAPIAGGGPLFDLERIEILRGPQGTLYGKNTTGGAVNVISKKPGFDTDGYATLGFGTKNERIVDTAIGGALVDERIAARLALYSEERDGFTKNLSADQSYGDENKKAARLQVLAKLNPDLEALWKVHTRVFKGDGSNGALPTGSYYGGAYVRPEGRYIELNTNEDNRLEHDGTSLTFNYDIGDYKLTSISAIDWIDQDTLLDSDYAPYDLNGYTDTSNSYRQYSQEFRLTSPQGELLRWILGSHFFHEDLDSSAQRTIPIGLLPNGSSNQLGATNPVYRNLNYDHNTDSYALFGNVTYDFTDKFSLTGGLRWTLEKKDIDLNLTQLVRNAGTGELQPQATPGSNGSSSLDKSWDAFTYDITPEYRFNDNLRAFFRYAHGFRSGGFNTGLSSSLGQLTSVDPEYLDSYEFGIKSEWFDGRLHANANVFYYDYEDIQVNVTTFNNNITTSALTNGAQGTVKGVELTLEAQPTENLHLQAALAYLDTEYTDFEDRNPTTGVLVGDYSGNAFARAPKRTAAFGADYTIPLSAAGKVVVGGDVSFRSREFFLANRQEKADEKRMSQDDYSLVNAHLTYYTPDEKYSVTGFVNNLTDKKYLVHGRPNGSAALDQFVIVYGDPRTAGVSFTARY
jgi:iron complex outermembrane receptor protein